jgi:hypothetical protein
MSPPLHPAAAQENTYSINVGRKTIYIMECGEMEDKPVELAFLDSYGSIQVRVHTKSHWYVGWQVRMDAEDGRGGQHVVEVQMDGGGWVSGWRGHGVSRCGLMPCTTEACLARVIQRSLS